MTSFEKGLVWVAVAVAFSAACSQSESEVGNNTDATTTTWPPGEVYVDPESGIGIYPDEEIRQSSPECTHVVDNERGAAQTFACEYTNRQPGDTMEIVADRVRFMTSPELDERLRDEMVPEELRGVTREVATQQSQLLETTDRDAAESPEADVAVATRTWYQRGAPGQPVEYGGPDTFHDLDMIVYLVQPADGTYTAVDYEPTDLPEDFFSA